MFDDVLKHRSGRVIGLARAVMAAVFLFAIWIDPKQPARAVDATYGLLSAYLVLAVGATILTWNNWWLDAKLAAAMHLVDILIFTLLVVASDGYTSPFFVFFVFLILSAAIRWGWRETALTAVPVTLIYAAVGIAAGASNGPTFDLQRFIIRSGNLVVLSAILIWFGINKGFAGFKLPKDDALEELSLRESPLQSAIVGAMNLTGAKSALLLWRGTGAHDAMAFGTADGEIQATPIPRSAVDMRVRRPFLFDLVRDRALCRRPQRRMRFFSAKAVVRSELADRFGVHEGLAVPIRAEPGEGTLLLGGIRSPCTDHLEFAEQLSDVLAAHIQRHALLVAVEDSATAKARLSLARDLHDSIVQFLAGATFRIEAITRSLRAGDQPERELKDLKQMLLEEQQELRSAIGALRSSQISLPSLAADIQVLCDRLGRQWDIDCNFSAEVPEVKASMRLHLDTHQLIREAVANAVRHAGAKSVRVQMAAEDSELRLDISDDGSAPTPLKQGSPWSLRERVDEANGTLMLASRETGTSVSITLPLNGDAHL